MNHTFTPTHYFTTLGWHEPVLKVADGDSLTTTTVDARGNDSSGENITERGNPMAGPFYIEGAEPGDTLQVTLDSIGPNREFGWTRKVVAANVVDPNYVRSLPDDHEIIDWQIDLEAGTATAELPGHTPDKIVAPLAPMLGCFGVAPPGGQSINTGTSGPNGGNMDYRGYVSGVTCYFPVFAEGALFHLGDGHATQGCGEIVGTGVEISMDVQVTFKVLKGKESSWPRGENDDYVFTVGNARPLDQCVQHATTEMLKWLQQDYGFDALAANMLLGQCVEYDLGNIFDPAYTMVCKVPKKCLA